MSAALIGAASLGTTAATAETLVQLNEKEDLDTFYVSVDVHGGEEEYLVDTGAGYMTITDATLARLQSANNATFIGHLDGLLADGSVIRVPIYRLSQITIGQTCVIHNVDAAVLPGASRGLFGLSALRKASPFEVSFDPPTLRLSNCGVGALAAQE